MYAPDFNRRPPPQIGFRAYFSSMWCRFEFVLALPPLLGLVEGLVEGDWMHPHMQLTLHVVWTVNLLRVLRLLQRAPR